MDHATATGLVPEQPADTWTPDPIRRAHEQDRAYLGTLTWRQGRCAFCRVDQARTTEFAHIEQGTLPGYSLRICYSHAAYELTLQRAEANSRGKEFSPDIHRLRP